LVLVIGPGQRAFFILCGGLVVDLGCGVWGPFVDHLWTPRGFEGLRLQEQAGLHRLANTRRGLDRELPVYIEAQIRGDNSGNPGVEDFLYVFKPGRHGPDAPPRAPACARSRSAPRARRAAGARHGLWSLLWLRPGEGGAHCAEPPPSVQPAARSDSAGPSTEVTVGL
jgi:hypothetical protein